MVKTITDKYKSKVPPNLKIQFTSYEEKSEKGDYKVDTNTIRLKKKTQKSTRLHRNRITRNTSRYGC